MRREVRAVGAANCLEVLRASEEVLKGVTVLAPEEHHRPQQLEDLPAGLHADNLQLADIEG